MKPTVSRDYRPVVGGTMALLSLAALVALFHLQSAQRPEAPATPAPAAEPPIQLYFTRPGEEPQAAESELVQAIDAARFSLDVATYHFNLWSVREALERAQRRGVSVRMVVDRDNLIEPEVEELIEAGVLVAADRGPGLMHHKFVVIDGLEVWTGSMNLSYGSARVDFNNWLRLSSRELAEDFQREFEEMVLDGRFGPASRPDTPHPHVQLDGTEIEVLFSPDDRVAARLVALLRGAERSIDVMAFAFTADALAEAILDRSRQGVSVRGVFDEGQASASGAEFSRFQQAGLDVRLDPSEGLLHHKVIVIDGEIVITGSYNFTRSAEDQNDEAVLILKDPLLARRFLEEFEALFRAAGSGGVGQSLVPEIATKEDDGRAAEARTKVVGG